MGYVSGRRFVQAAFLGYFSSKLLPALFVCHTVQSISPILNSMTQQNICTMVEDEIKAACKNFPPLLAESKHKGLAGRIGIIGGSLEYTGAPYFAGISALKSGADLVYIFCMKDAAVPIKSYCPELIVFPYLDAENGQSLTIPRLQNLHSLVIGPGLGEYVAVHSLVVSLINYIKGSKKKDFSLVFDADGIGLVANNKDILKDFFGNVYITPNMNEIKKLSLAYLGQRDIDTEDKNKLMELVANISPNATMVLKGQVDKIVTQKNVYECSAPGSLRRVGGQGDLLSGSLGLFSYWANLYKEQNSNSTFPPEVLAAYSSCLLTRTCSKMGFEKRGRAMITSDMIGSIGEAYDSIFLR